MKTTGILLLLFPHGSLKHRTEKAYLFIIEGKEIWLPSKLIKVDDFEGVPIVKCPDWLIYKNNLTEYLSLDEK